MRILIVTQYYYPENVVVSDIAKELRRRGHDVTVVTGKPNYGYDQILPEYKKVKYEVLDGVRIFRLNLKARKKNRLSIIFNYLSFYFNSRRFLRHFKEEYDVVYSHSLSPIISVSGANIYKKKHHINHVLHCLDLWPISPVITHAVKMDGILYKLLYRWSRSIYDKCDKILLSSPSFIDYFKDTLHLEEKYYKYIPQPPLHIEGELDLKPIKYPEGFHFLYVGNIGKLQGVELLPYVMKEVLKTRSDIYFHIIGKGQNQDKLKKNIEDLGVHSHCTYYGSIPMRKARYYYPDADCLYLSLIDDGVVGKTIPSKLISYLTYSKPILGVISGDGKKILEDTNGAIISTYDVSTIVNHVLEIANLKEEERIKMGQNNYKYYQSHFQLERIVDMIEKELLTKKI